MSKCGSNYTISNCALEGGLIGAVLWSNQAYSILRPYLLHFFFNNNSKDSSEILIFLFPCPPWG